MNMRRAGFLLISFTLVLITLGVRIFYLQFYTGKSLSIAADTQRISDIDIDFPRGDILDRNSIPLTNRTKEIYVVLKPIYLREKESEMASIAEILGLELSGLKRDIAFRKSPMIMTCSQYEKDALTKLNSQGISFINSLKRYSENSVAKHLTGYINEIDKTGQTGLEKFFQDTLKLNSKSSVGVITDAKNNLVTGLGYRFIEPEPVNKLSVKLTLDYHIQRIAEDVMKKSGLKGAVVIEDVVSGNVVAMLSKPDYDPNNIEKYLSSADKELFNRAVASYNLGSIFKIIALASAYENGIDPNMNYFCPGYINLGDKEFKCGSYAKGGHGFIGLEEAFASSCNPYFIELGIKVGATKIINTAKKFGLGNYTGVNEQGIEESAGNLPDPNKYYTYGDIANISIGQGDVLSTPLQVADIVSTIANGGIKNRVNIVDSIIDSDNNTLKVVKSNEGKRIISKKVCDKIKLLMEMVTISGTGIKANLEKYGGAGAKTGSAETGQYINGEKIVHAWFAGYFPRLNPRYSVCVFIENGKSGGTIAAPIFEEIAREILVKGL
ncbi:peptidoglycan D,D-transpeptidase FtsI family protein [Acetivibrio cellulolyticus]|uniref:peptidoglycan D,D-transpeptidase FtsI family protein n=1 Tax=Acetivibrio cellulolyticus TaxID=35830 RepID=UPI0001E2D0C5|nr:penicillin-binding transpeptidase domain-containing protein [Acetivibrio cellulolyticus]